MSLKKVPGWYSNPDSVPGTMMVGFHCFLRGLASAPPCHKTVVGASPGFPVGGCEEASPEDFLRTKGPWVPHPPGFPIGLGALNALHAAFLTESRTRDHGWRRV